MKSDLSKNFQKHRDHHHHKREACLFNAERSLPCGSQFVSERQGRIIAKTSIYPQPKQ